MNLDYVQLFRALRPETSLVVGALLVLALDLSLFRQHTVEERLRLALLVGSLSVASAMASVWFSILVRETRDTLW